MQCNIYWNFCALLMSILPLIQLNSTIGICKNGNNNNVRIDNLNTSSDLTNVAGWKCFCSNATSETEVECHCEGETLTQIPQTFRLPVHRITITSAGLKRLRNTALQIYSSTLLDIVLVDIKLLETIENEAFANLKQLRTIYISHAPKLRYLCKEVFRNMSSTIKFIRIINTGLIKIPNLMYLQSKNILQMLDLDNNRISQIDSKSINIKSEQLILANNAITYIDESAFYGSQIAFLNLKGNCQLREMHSNAFHGASIQELDLSNTSLRLLPSAGVEDIEVLRLENTQTLKTIPSIYYFKNLQRAFLTHPFHCCAFKFPSRHDPQRYTEYLEEIKKWQMQCKSNKRPKRNIKNKGLGNFTSRSNNYIVSAIERESGVFHDPIDIEFEQFEEYCGNFTFRNQDVECHPEPNALNPCEDVMGYRWLRIAVWLVMALALLGNVTVLIVIFSIRSKTASVSRFLIAHLAFADFCLGLYLLLIASIDIISMGKYFNFAYDWQYGVGCKIAGFLTVFAYHLSVYTLTIITIERWMAITHALHTNYRIQLKQAMYVMIFGCLYSVIMSTLPLFGFSNYSSTSICMPVEDGDFYDTVYLVAIITFNGLAFFIIALCYIQIYMSLDEKTRQGHITFIGDMTMATKMALLVFTNFACWAPIAFFGITALAGYPLISVTKSKILLVFFYPLNSCADPYLYALLTKQYRQDLYSLLRKLRFSKANTKKSKNTTAIDVVHSTQYNNSFIQSHQALLTEVQIILL